MNSEDLLKQYKAGCRDFSNLDLKQANLAGADLSGSTLRGTDLSFSNLSGVNFTKADLSQAVLTSARLTGANLSGATLVQANLDAASLKRAIVIDANLQQASLVRAELIYADFAGSDLTGVRLREVDLRNGNLKQVNLRQTILSQADLRGCALMGANLEEANLHGANLNRADVTGANLGEADLQHANLNCASLQGSILQGANLRWVDLNGADVQWANCQAAKLSGATLIGTNFSHANLSQASLVHADLTRANLMSVDWSGADLTGVTLTGAKLNGVFQFDLISTGIICDWVGLSPNGDRSQVRYFETEADLQQFFNQKPPTIKVVVDAVLDQTANCTLAQAYYQLGQQYPQLRQPPSVDIGTRQTKLTFKVEQDADLLVMGLIVMLPFQDAPVIRSHLLQALQAAPPVIPPVPTTVPTLPIGPVSAAESAPNGHEAEPSSSKAGSDVAALRSTLTPSRVDPDSAGADSGTAGSPQLNPGEAKAPDQLSPLEQIQQVIRCPALNTAHFFQCPSQVVLTNSNSRTLRLYQHPHFGQPFLCSVKGPSRADRRSKQSWSQRSVVASSDQILAFLNQPTA